MTTPAIAKAVRAKFCAPEWATFFEVHNSTGATQRRAADAIAMNLFPSRGLRLHGFEFKASRGDWLRELKDPAKSWPIQRYCDHWWIVALPDIVKPDELPPTWGLYVLKGSGLHAIVKAPPLEAEAVDAPFLAALLRRANEFANGELERRVRESTADAEARIEERIRAAVDRRALEHKDLRAQVEAFEKASGVSITEGLWSDGAEVGRAVKLVRSAGVVSTWRSIESLARQAREMAERIEKTMEELGAPGITAEAAE